MFNKKKRKLTIVIGASRLGATIANHCSKNGIYTVIIDKDPISFRKLDSDYAGIKIDGDAEEMEVLNEANIQEATEVNVLTNNDNANIYIANVILKKFNVPHLVVRLMDSTKTVLLDSDRVRIISPSILSYKKYLEFTKDFDTEDNEK